MPIKKYYSALPHWNIHYQKVLLRVDLNVPLDNTKILDDTKLHAIRPTLDYLIAQKTTIIMLTHIGRPKGFDFQLSTKHLLPWFYKHHYTITFAQTIKDVQDLLYKHTSTIILLENLRFFPGETSHEIHFAQSLKILGDYFVHDGFACMHNNDTSNTTLPLLFDTEHKTIGLYTQQELNRLETQIQHIQSPFVVILGGSKLNTKIEYINHFIDKADACIICPALAFTFLEAQGIAIGNSLVYDDCLQKAYTIIQKTIRHGIPFIMPKDIQIEENHAYRVVPVNEIPSTARGISIGPQTLASIEPIINNAHTIVYNGAIGFIDQIETLQGMKALLLQLKKSNAHTIVCGGDTTAIVHKFGMENSYSYLSAGGGVILAYMVYHTLPALQALNIMDRNLID
ncbi:MAG TPA: phosphoglycerate kinase [Candidatus Babeliales bacterium]|jgi:phosphoglycerate kinase|nr:phosphoglycerate kinase [Candidatus Babeliales bacterium]